MAVSTPGWEIFCRIVDNFGDIGVSLRLARELALRSQAPVRLWLDDWTALHKLCPHLPSSAPATGWMDEGVELRQWQEAFIPVGVGAVVIEAFGCELPAAQLQAMLACQPPPCWINLEYLSAEDWVASCHGLGSPHPQLGLHKYFFFPGFGPESGGLLREADLLARRDAFLASDARSAWLTARGVDHSVDDLCISLFAYQHPALGDLLKRWASGSQRVHLLVPEGRMLTEVERALGEMGSVGSGLLIGGDPDQHGQLIVHAQPFVDQREFDALLWACDVNFVRGEDSFVRAQWAGLPLVWQLYPQQEDAHFDKLAAFLARYLAGLPAATATAVETMWLAWNGRGEPTAAWPDFAAQLPVLRQHAQHWAAQQAQLPDLATALIRFCHHIDSAAG